VNRKITCKNAPGSNIGCFALSIVGDVTQLGFGQLLSQYTRLPRQAQPLSLTHPFSHVINWYIAKLASFLACKLAFTVLNLSEIYIGRVYLKTVCG
jgi:hypothetical protein